MANVFLLFLKWFFMADLAVKTDMFGYFSKRKFCRKRGGLTPIFRFADLSLYR